MSVGCHTDIVGTRENGSQSVPLNISLVVYHFSVNVTSGW